MSVCVLLPVLPVWFWMPCYLLSGAAALTVVERGHRVAGIALLILGAVEFILCMCVRFDGGVMGKGAYTLISLMI